MPSLDVPYEVLLDFTNDTGDNATIQLAHNYGLGRGTVLLLHPGETVTLVLDAGSTYHYALKWHAKVANVTACAWRDLRCNLSPFFRGSPWSRSELQVALPAPVNCVAVDRLWKDNRFSIWDDDDEDP